MKKKTSGIVTMNFKDENIKFRSWKLSITENRLYVYEYYFDLDKRAYGWRDSFYFSINIKFNFTITLKPLDGNHNNSLTIKKNGNEIQAKETYTDKMED